MKLYFWRYVVPDAAHYTEQQPYYECQRIISNACDVVWCESYWQPGSFSALLPASRELMEFFWDLDLIVTRDETDRAMVVESVEIMSKSGGDYIRITGPSAEGLTNRRVIMQRDIITMNGPAAVVYYVRQNFGDYWYYNSDDQHPHGMNYASSRRFFNLFHPDADQLLIPATVSAEPFGRNLGEFIVEICKGLDFGFRCVFDGQKFLYSCYRGVDRSLNQTERAAVVFAENFKNLGESTYTRSVDDYYSHVVVGGSGTGTGRQYNEAYRNFRTPAGVGMNMREKFISSSGTSDIALGYAAKNAVLAAQKTSDFDVETVSNARFQYRKDYFLGDTVSVINRFGVSGTATVAEVVETESAAGFYIIPKLANFAGGDVIVPERPYRAEYKQVEWIQSTGSGEEYILTDIVPKHSMRIELDAGFGGPDYDITDIFDKYIFGMHGMNLGNIFVRFGDERYMIGYEDVDFVDGFSNSTSRNMIHDANISDGFAAKKIVLQRGTCYWGSQTCVCDDPITEPEPTLGMPIFGAYITGSAVFHGLKRREMRFYRMKFLNGETLLHDLIPVERQNDSAIGLLDIKTRRFYNNSGSGTFEKGGYVEDA